MIGPGPKKPKLAAHDMVHAGAPGTADASGPPDLPVNLWLGEGG